MLNLQIGYDMDIEDIKSERSHLEFEILSLIRDFEHKTDVNVCEIGLQNEDVNGMFGIKYKQKRVEVKINI